jgi:hypothetical protein
VTWPRPSPSPDHTPEDRTPAGDEGAGTQASPADSPPAFVIVPEFRGLIPPLTADERQQLAPSLEAHGCLDALKLWVRDDGQPPVLLDGHTHHDLCPPRGAGPWYPHARGGHDLHAAPPMRATESHPLRAHRGGAETDGADRGAGQAATGARTDLFQKSGTGWAPIHTDREVAKLAAVSHDTV